MVTGAAGAGRSGAISEQSNDVLLTDQNIEIDLRSGEPQIRTVDGAASKSIPRVNIGDVVPLFGPSARTAPPPPVEIPVGGFLQRAIARNGQGQAIGVTYRFMKRVSDAVISTLLTLVLLPILIGIAALVGLTSRGSVLYKQKRIGRGGSTYTMLKFRSMTVDADDRLDEMSALADAGEVHPASAPMFKAPDDPRVTKVGRIIRRTGLDELPQLFNIIAGQMSLIGPRPLPINEAVTLSPADSEIRHSVRPGVSGLWQVMRTSDMDFEERIALDLLYVDRRSVFVDWTVLLMTPLAILRGQGLY